MYQHLINVLGLNDEATNFLPLYALLKAGAALDNSPPNTAAGVLAKLQSYVGASPTARELLQPLSRYVDRNSQGA